MKSRAAVLFEVGKGLEVCEVDVQDPGPGEVRIQMAAGGVCHSDLHVMTGHLNAPLPAILGHEGAGIVADVGAGVTDVKPGDHVIPLWRLSCGECEYCSGGRPALCAAGTEIRWSGRLLDGTTRFKLAGKEIKHFAGVSSFSIPLERAALLGCAVITGVGAVINQAEVRPGRSVAVFGTGGVGVNVVQGAALAGAEKIIAVDLMDSRLEQAKRFGATHAVNGSNGDPVEQIREITGGRGVDYSFEVIGLPVTMRQAYDCLAKRGVATLVGITPTTAEVTLPALSLVYEERTVTGSLYGSASAKTEIPRLIDLYRAGNLMLDELLTRTYPIEEINQAYADLESGETLRSVVTF